MDGFLNLHKPVGLTSHDCVAKLRRLLRLKRIGHGGTLDPAATGVLPMALGRATRLLQYLDPNKAYVGTVRLGLTTTTDDLAGEVLSQGEAVGLGLEAIATALGAFQGEISQIPPRYSAIQVEGQRLYDRARAGEVFEVPERRVWIESIEVLAWRPGSYPEVDLAIACGPGTYIRSIARDLGAVLGVGGTLAALRRTRSCGLDLAESLTLEQVADLCGAGGFVPIAPMGLLGHLPVYSLSEVDAIAWSQGKKLAAPGELPLGTAIAVQDGAGDCLGIGEVEVRAIGASPEMAVLCPRLVLNGRG